MFGEKKQATEIYAAHPLFKWGVGNRQPGAILRAGRGRAPRPWGMPSFATGRPATAGVATKTQPSLQYQQRLARAKAGLARAKTSLEKRVLTNEVRAANQALTALAPIEKLRAESALLQRLKPVIGVKPGGGLYWGTALRDVGYRMEGFTPYFQDYTTKLAPFGVPGPIERAAYMSGFGDLGFSLKLPRKITGNWLVHTLLPVAGAVAAVGGAYYLGPSGVKALGSNVGTFFGHVKNFFVGSGMAQTAATAAANAVMGGQQPVPNQVLQEMGPGGKQVTASMFGGGGGNTMMWLIIGGVGLIALFGLSQGRRRAPAAAPAPAVAKAA